MPLILQVVLGFICFWLAVWTISTVALLLTPIPEDPWRKYPVPVEGEYVRVGDGAELFIRLWMPEAEAKQVILGLHGLGQHSGYHHRFGEALAEAGIAYYALDIRGNGFTRTPHGDVPSIDRLYSDLDDLIQELQNRHPQAQIYVLGHSMGAAMAASWTAERSPKLSGLIILSPAMTVTSTSVPWSNYIKGPAAWLFFRHRSVWAIGKAAYAWERLNRLINLPDQVDFIVQDPLQLKSMSMEFALAQNRFRKTAIPLAPQISDPTLTLVGNVDDARKGAKQFSDALTEADKSFFLVPNATHMLFQIEEMSDVVRIVIEWLFDRVQTKYER